MRITADEKPPPRGCWLPSRRVERARPSAGRHDGTHHCSRLRGRQSRAVGSGRTPGRGLGPNTAPGGPEKQSPHVLLPKGPLPSPQGRRGLPAGLGTPACVGECPSEPPTGMLSETPVYPSRGFGDLVRDPAGHLPASWRELKAQRLIPTTKLSRNTGDTECLPADSGGEHFRGGRRRPLGGLGAAGLSLRMLQRLTFPDPQRKQSALAGTCVQTPGPVCSCGIEACARTSGRGSTAPPRPRGSASGATPRQQSEVQAAAGSRRTPASGRLAARHPVPDVSRFLTCWGFLQRPPRPSRRSLFSRSELLQDSCGDRQPCHANNPPPPSEHALVGFSGRSVRRRPQRKCKASGSPQAFCSLPTQPVPPGLPFHLDLSSALISF